MGRKIRKFMVIAILLGFLGGLTEYFGPSINVEKGSVLDTDQSVKVSSAAPVISAEGAILINQRDGSVLYEKDADKKLYPASTTKIMTTLLALETLEEIDGAMDSKITVPADAVGVEGSSLYLKEGEVVTAEELLYGAMLQSGNDAATALAICFGATEEAFVERMNEKAKELGCRATNFVNPSGLFDENHFTTARDLAKIGSYAMKNDTFRQIAASEEWSGEGSGRSFVNKNKTVREYEGATGIKIGYTKKSGRTLVASAKRGEDEFIAVVLNDPNWFQDAYAMLDYGFQLMESRQKGGLQ